LSLIYRAHAATSQAAGHFISANGFHPSTQACCIDFREAALPDFFHGLLLIVINKSNEQLSIFKVPQKILGPAVAISWLSYTAAIDDIFGIRLQNYCLLSRNSSGNSTLLS